MSAEDDIVENYLDELFVELHGRPRLARRMLAETEEHLHLAMAEELARGTGAQEAAAAAVARFGRAGDVAHTWNANTPAEPLPLVLRRTVSQLLPLTVVGLIAVGLSGLAAQLMTAIWGRTFTFAGPPGATYPAASCRYWLSIHSNAGNCANAYVAEAQADGLLARYAAGALGLVLLGVLLLIRRRRGMPAFGRASMLRSLTGTVLFLAAAVGLLALGIDSVRTADSHGAGQWLSGAVIAFPLAAVYGFALLRSERRSPALI